MEQNSIVKILPLFLFLLSLCLFLILGEKFNWLKPMRPVVEKLTVPVKTKIYRIWQGSFGILETLNERTKNLADLEKQSQEVSVLKVKLEVLEEENKALRRQLEAPLPPQVKFLPAKTIGLTRYLAIDKGQEDGVKEGMMVVSENILVGKVIETTSKTAQVLLPTDPKSKIPGRTLKTNARGLVIGEFGTKLSITQVLQSEVLETDDLVVTSGGGGYEKDLLVGKIAKIEQNPVEPFQKAEVSPLLDYGKLVNVFIIK